MLEYNIDDIPRQSFNIFVDGRNFRIDLKRCANIMAASVYIDEVPLIENRRCVAGSPLVPYGMMRGNFFILTQADELPINCEFGKTNRFVFLDEKDLASVG